MTRCWREMDSNHRFPAKFLRLLAIPDQYRRKRSRLAAVAEGFWVRFAPDSPVEREGFDQIRSWISHFNYLGMGSTRFVTP